MCFSLLNRTNAKEVCMKRIARTSLLEYSNKNRKEGNFNDIEICVGSFRFPCNRMVLSCYSLFFERMFVTEMKEKYQKRVEIKSIDGETMKSIIEYIYNGELNINSENVCKLLSAADYLQIEDLKRLCITFIEETITADNCFLVLKIADLYRSDKLSSKAVKIMGEHFEEASTTEEFKCLSESEMENCISQLKQEKIKETAKFNAIIRWTEHNKANRITTLHKLIKLIDLYKLPLDFLQSVVLAEDLILEDLELCKLCLKVQSTHINQLKTKDKETKILGIGGTDTLSKAVEVFNCTNAPPSVYPQLPEGRSTGCAVVLHGHLYYIGGKDKDRRDINTVKRLRLQDRDLRWEEVCSMNKNRSVMGAAAFLGNLAVVGSGGQESAECYSPLFNSWTPLSPLQQPRFRNALVVCDDRLYAIGGYSDEQSLSSVECLSTVGGKWEYVKPMQTPRRWLAAVSYDGFIYAVGGTSDKDGQTRLKTVEKYDPSLNTWKFVAEMNMGHSACAACVLQGRIFVVGGVGEIGGIVKDIECYDPLFDKWSIVGETADGFYNHTIVAV